MSSVHKTVTVIGATGNQGSGVVAALLTSTDFAVRAVTTDLAGRKAEALRASHKDAIHFGRLRLVQADLDKVESLEEALRGSYGVFLASTFRPSSGSDTQQQESLEVRQGKNLVDAAKAAGVQHLVYSALPSLAELSGGRFTHAAHWESKAVVAEYAKARLPALTLLYPGFFYSNLHTPLFAQRQADQSVVFSLPVSEEAKLSWVDDRSDIGTFAAAALEAGPAVAAGKAYPVGTPGLTVPQFAAEYERATGEKARFVRPDPDAAKARQEAVLGPEAYRELSEMWQYVSESTVDGTLVCNGTMRRENDTSHEDLGVRATTLSEYIHRTGFRVSGF
ncbi:hypothetical protein JCM8202_000378 [Rhodotorula sphaerocarpa]